MKSSDQRWLGLGCTGNDAQEDDYSLHAQDAGATMAMQ